MKALDIILSNFPHCEESKDSSFSGRLHEERLVDLLEYWKLEWAVWYCSKPSKKPANLVWPVGRIFSCLENSLFSHFEPNDGYAIRGVTPEFMRMLSRRIQVVFEGFFKGEPADMRGLFKERNPLLCVEFEGCDVLSEEVQHALKNEALWEGLTPPSVEELAREKASYWREIILNNMSGSELWCEHSFMGFLQGSKEIDKLHYWTLEWALVEYSKLQHPPEDLTWPVFKIFSDFSMCCLAHADSQHDFKIADVDPLWLIDFTDRFQMVFECFLRKETPVLGKLFEEENFLLTRSAQ